jgi:hypothetical protein
MARAVWRRARSSVLDRRRTASPAASRDGLPKAGQLGNFVVDWHERRVMELNSIYPE